MMYFFVTHSWPMQLCDPQEGPIGFDSDHIFVNEIAGAQQSTHLHPLVLCSSTEEA